MRINGTGGSSAVGKKGNARRSSSGGEAFTIGSAAETHAANSTSSSGPVTGIDAILALQGVEDPLYAQRRALKRGHSLLDILEDLKADLILGRINESKLQGLMRLVAQARSKSDPKLDAVIDDIELRARVELAKLGRFPGF